MTHAHLHVHIARGAAALAAAMGIGRFVYTPILPLMTGQAGLSATAASGLATANYAGYLAGAMAGVLAPKIVRTVLAWRTALVGVVASLAVMPLTQDVAAWLAIRAMAGFASAVLFVIAVDWMLDHARGRSPQLAGWGFGGVGAGIALSGALVLLLPTSGWRVAWWSAAALAAVVGLAAWHMTGAPPVDHTGVKDLRRQPRSRRWFGALLASYTLEGIGYIIAGTFLVAAIGANSQGSLGSAAWLVVGLAAIPSAALWAWAATRWSHPSVLVAALLLQAAGIALPAFVSGASAAVVGAALFGGTFLGVSTVSLAAGRMLAVPSAVAVLTAGYSVGQILGPLIATPLLHQGFRYALIASAAVVFASALVATWLRIGAGRLTEVDADRRRVATSPDRPAATGPHRR